MRRYDRQMRIDGWNQEKLLSSRASLVGAGALGVNVGIQLASLGVGRIDIYDHDTIEETNLNRQFIYYDSVGKPKATTLAERLMQINPDVKAEAYVTKIDNTTIYLLGYPDVILDCLDNYESRAIVLNYAINENIPLVSGGVAYSNAHVFTYIDGKAPIDYKALARSERKDRENSCLEEPNPSIITVNWIIAGIMADEARKILAPINEKDRPLCQLLVFDLFQDHRFGTSG